MVHLYWYREGKFLLLLGSVAGLRTEWTQDS